MIPLTDSQILSRRFNYGCCRLDYLDKWVKAKAEGDEKCAKENWRMFLFMSFAKEIVSNIPVEGESHKCADPELAIKVIKRADCFCECRCAPPPPTNCDIPVSETAIDLCDTPIEGVRIEGFGTADGLYLPNGDTYPFNGIDYPYFMKVGGIPYQDQVRMLASGAWSVWETDNGVIARDPNDYSNTDPIGTPPFRPWLIPEWWDGDVNAPLDPQPVVEQATIADTCEQDPIEMLDLIVEQPEDGLYAIGCCEGGTLFFQRQDDVWAEYTPAEGTTIEDDGVLFIYQDGDFVALFPSVNMVLVTAPATYFVSSQEPGVDLGRTIRLEGLGPNGWYAMWLGNESELPLNINLLGLPFTEVRLRYTLDNGCEYFSPIGTITPPVDECGTIVASTEVVENCILQQYSIELAITSIDGYPLGNTTVTVNGVVVSSQPAVLGITVLGPFSTETTVEEVRVSNAADSECDLTFGPFSVETNCDCEPNYQVDEVVGCGSLVGAFVVVASDLSGVYAQSGDELNGRPTFVSLSNSDYALAWDGTVWGMYEISTDTFLFLSTGDVSSPAEADWSASTVYFVSVEQATLQQYIDAGGNVAELFAFSGLVEGYSLIFSGCNGSFPLNTILTWNGEDFDETTLDNPSVVEDVNNTLWWYNGTVLVQQFPVVDLSWNYTTFVFTSQYPQTHTVLDRVVRLEVENYGEWVVMYEGPESVLAANFPLLNPFPPDPEITGVRATYIVGPCEYPQVGTPESNLTCLTAAYEVAFSVDLEEALTCRAGQRIHIRSDNNNYGGPFPVGSIIEDNVLVATPQNGEPIYATVTDDWWVNTPGGPGSLFPRLQIRHVEDSLTILFSSPFPQVHNFLQRDYLLEGTLDGVTWDEISSGNETALAGGLALVMGSAYRGFRLSYQYTPGCDSSTIYEQIELDIPIMLVVAQDETGTGFTMWRSYNQGDWVAVQTWATNPAGGGSQMTRTHPLDSDKVLFAGFQTVGGIRHSTDRGRTWNTPGGDWTDPWPAGISASRRGWYQSSYAEDGSMWVAGPRRVARSIDGGATFNDVNIPPDLAFSTETLYVCAINEDIAIVAGEGNNRVFRTTDGGSTYSAVTNVSGRDFTAVSWFQYPSLLHLGGGRVLAFSNSAGGVGGPAYCLISNDYGQTFTSWAITNVPPVTPTNQQARPIYGWNDGASLLGRNFHISDDAGATWFRSTPCNDPAGTFATFLINKRFYTGVGKFQSLVPPSEGNAFTEDKGWTMQPNPNLFPVSPVNGIAPLSPGSFGWPLQPKPRFLGLAPETEMFMFDVVGDASSGDLSGIVTSTGFWTLKNENGTFEVITIGNNPSDLSALSGIYRIYSSDAQGNPAGVITSIVVFGVPMDPIDFSGLPSLLDVTWNGAIAAPLLSGSPLVSYVDYSNSALPAPPDLSPNPLLQVLNMSNCGLITRPDLTGTPLITDVNLSPNDMPANEVNLLLHEINLHNTDNVNVDLRFGTNAPPDTTSGGVNGVAAAAAIVSRGGTVQTN